MKRVLSLILALTLTLALAACGGKGGWQEQYDLGQKYLTEGNYEEAILAFTAAIEIDPKRAPAYVGRGSAYALSGDTEGNLTAAETDFTTAIELDETDPDAWLGLADVYIRMGDYDKAQETLERALEALGDDDRITAKLAEMEEGRFTDSDGHPRKTCHYEDGALVEYWLYDYDEKGNNIRTSNYDADGTWQRTEESEFNDAGQEIRMVETSEDGTRTEVYTYDAQGRRIREDRTNVYEDSQSTGYTLISYDDAARTETHESYYGGKLENRFVIEMDEAVSGRRPATTCRTRTGSCTWITTWSTSGTRTGATAATIFTMWQATGIHPNKQEETNGNDFQRHL